MYSQNNLMNQIKYTNNIVNNSILQHKIEQIGVKLEKIRQDIRRKRMEAIDDCLNSTYDPNDQDKIRQFYNILKGDSSFDFYGIDIDHDTTTFDKIQILEQIQEVFGTLYKDPNYANKIDTGLLIEYACKARRQVLNNHHKFIPSDEHIEEMLREFNMNGTITLNGIGAKV